MEKTFSIDWLTFLSRVLRIELADMHRALARTDSADLVTAAHALKGSCTNFGGSSLRELCAKIEQVGMSGELGDVADLIASAEKELEKLIEMLKAYRKAYCHD
jgi:HPt (histidine-containing phosphotransfer) domain-containing protein